jgi:NTE family protein
MAMLAGTQHTADVVALRDCEVLALPRDAFFEAARTEPDLMVELSRLMIQRARERRSGAGEPSVFGFLSARPRPIRAFVERVAAAIEADGFTCQVIDNSALSSAADWFSRVEDAHDFVLYVAELEEAPWAALCARQVDRLFIVGAGLLAPPNRPMPHAGVLDARRRTDLILLRDPRMARPANTAVWLDAIQPGRWFQAVEGDQADAARIARVVTGSAVGVVMSGGGARAYSHIGVLRALREAKVPIDFVGGSSMGAIIAAGPAMGWSQEELEARIHKAFVESDPLSDITFPMLAMTRAKKVDCLLEEAYGEVDLADLVRPFFAVSTNLTSGKIEVHRRGLMRRAMRASIAIPGILPPIVIDGQVLVDGAVLKNLPTEVMRQMNAGPVIGVDMSEARGVDPDLIENPPSIWSLIVTGAWRRGPPIVSILMRSATLTTDADIESSRAASDVLIQPTPDGLDIRDWKGFDAGVAAGYLAAAETLAKLDGPVTGLRRRRAISDVAPPETAVGRSAGSRRPDVEDNLRQAVRRARKETPDA